MFESFKKMGISAGMPENQALAFAGCCVACKQYGCQYGERMTVMMKDLLIQYPENPYAKNVLTKLNAPWSDFHEPDFKGPPPPPRSNRSHMSPNYNYRNHDRQPKRFRNNNRRWGNQYAERRRKKRWREPEPNTMGRVGSKRRRTSPCPDKMAREPKRQASGSHEIKSSIPNFNSNK